MLYLSQQQKLLEQPLSLHWGVCWGPMVNGSDSVFWELRLQGLLGQDPLSTSGQAEKLRR